MYGIPVHEKGQHGVPKHSARNLLYFFILSILCSLSLSVCHFDKIQLPLDSLAHVSVRYNRVHVRDLEDRCRSTAWKPVRIYVHFDSLSTLTDHDKFRLHTVVESAIERIKRLLSIKPVIGPLLLRRNKACSSVHTVGVNKGKCASIRPGYQKEYCGNKVDNFQIPDQHLMGVDVYDEKSSTLLAASIASAAGVNSSDYVLYVTAERTDYCLAENIIAYASYCQLDQNDRPIAGLVNLCPSHLKTEQFSHSKAVLAVIHELFHAFGFSSELFTKYKECSVRGHCFQWKKVVVRDDAQFRVVLPSVISRMQRHFNCSQDDLGAPLEPIDGNFASSHWDPLVLHYSIMSPHISEPHLMSVDPITLAVFDDMGWYRVNYSDVDNYQWASGAGCDFVHTPQCNNKGSCPSYLCDLRKDAGASGCDYFHSSVSSCSAITKHYGDVGIYKPVQQGNCQSSIIYNEEKQGCFLSIINGMQEGQCMQYQCSGDKLEVLVNHDWWPCPPNSEIFIEESGQNISCPTSDILCKIQHRVGSHQYLDFVGGVAVWIQLKSPIPSVVRAANGNEDDVRSDAVAELSRTAGVPISWINRTILLAQEYYLLGLLLVPPVDSDFTKQELDVVYHRIQQLTNNGGLNFTYVRHTQELQAVTEEESGPFKNLRGVYILLLMSGIVVVVVIISAIGATLIQLAFKRPVVVRSRLPREFTAVAQ